MLALTYMSASMGFSASLQIANTTYSVKGIGGVALPNPAVGSGYGVALGYFTSSFTPTISNISSWFPNFVGYRGYWDNAPNISVALTLKFIPGPLNDPDNGTFDNIPVGAANSSAINIVDNVSQFIEGRPLKLVIWGDTWNTTSPSAAKGVGIFSNSGWVVPSVYDIESPDALVNSLFINTSTIADIGLIDNSTTGLTPRTITLIPEPSSASLLLGGSALALALRRNRALFKGKRTNK